MDKLLYLNEYLQIALKKKDEIISVTMQENKDLREEVSHLRNIIKTKELKIEELKKSIPVFNQKQNV